MRPADQKLHEIDKQLTDAGIALGTSDPVSRVEAALTELRRLRRDARLAPGQMQTPFERAIVTIECTGVRTASGQTLKIVSAQHVGDETHLVVEDPAPAGQPRHCDTIGMNKPRFSLGTKFYNALWRAKSAEPVSRDAIAATLDAIAHMAAAVEAELSGRP